MSQDDTPTTSFSYDLRPRPTRQLPGTRLPSVPAPATAMQPSASAAFEATVPHDNPVFSPGNDGSMSQPSGQYLPHAAASPAAQPSAPAHALHPPPPYLAAPYAAAPVQVQYVPVAAMGDWLAGLQRYLWPGQCARGFAFRLWHRGAIQGLRAAVAQYPDGTVTPSRLLQALRSIAEMDNNYTSEYAQWLDHAVEVDGLPSRAAHADAFSSKAAYAVEWFEGAVFQPWVAKFGASTQLDRNNLESVAYPNEPGGKPMTPAPPPHIYVCTIVRLYTSDIDRTALARLLRRIQAMLPHGMPRFEKP